jgi:hypothetical protein
MHAMPQFYRVTDGPSVRYTTLRGTGPSFDLVPEPHADGKAASKVIVNVARVEKLIMHLPVQMRQQLSCSREFADGFSIRLISAAACTAHHFVTQLTESFSGVVVEVGGPGCERGQRGNIVGVGHVGVQEPQLVFDLIQREV